MHVEKSERKVAAQLRITVNSDVAITLQEGDLSNNIWVAVYGRNAHGVGVVSFTITAEELAELCATMQNFANSVVAEAVKVLEPAH